MSAASLTGVRDDPARIAQLRSALWSAGYQARRVSEVLGADRRHLQPDPPQALLLHRQLTADDALSTLIRLFILGRQVPHAEAAKALAPLTVEGAEHLGVVTRAGDQHVESLVRITPYDEFLFACSRAPDIAASDRNHVMGITGSSINLANLTIRSPVDLTLDLGSGCGFQSLFASRHSSHVIATDVNPAAVAFTRFNARLNGVDNIECREGSFLDPVEGEQFDLIVSNPPFVISPDSSLLFRDSGMTGDELSRKVVADAARALRAGGAATILISWGRKSSAPWDEKPRQWVEGSGCDAWIFHQASQPVLMHSASWHQHVTGDLAAYDAGIRRWTEHISRLGFDVIAYGAVVLRRRDGHNWVRAEELPEPMVEEASDQLLRMTAAQDFLGEMADRRALLDERLALVRGHRLDQTMVCVDGAYSVERATLQLTGGLEFRANVDAFNAYLVSRLDGSRTLRDAVAEAAAAVSPGVDGQDVEAAALRSVRRMLELGFLHRNPSK